MKLNKLKPQSLARVILALTLTFAILVGSAYVTILMTKNRLKEYAVSMAEQKSVYVKTVTSMLFISSDWIVNSFMAGMADVECGEFNSTTYEKDCRYVLSDKVLNRLTTDDVYARLQSFINYHSDLSAALMILEPGVIGDAPHGIAAKVASHDSVRYDLNENYDVYGSELYRTVRASGRKMSHDALVTDDSLFMTTVGVPMYDRRGRFIGEFWVDTDADTYSAVLDLYKSDNDVVAALVTQDCQIVSSTNKENNGKYIWDVTKKATNGCDFPTEWYSEVQRCLKSDSSHHFRYKTHDDFVVTYIFPIALSPYRLLLIKPERMLYNKVQHIIWRSMLILFGSILLVSLCLVYIFLVFKHKNDENARMEGELNIAAELQRSILPADLSPSTLVHSPFDIFGYQKPAKSVGGDLYDFVQRGDLLHFCIGDVSGKGMPAALVMGEICSLYRYIISDTSDPAEIVSRINNAVMERSDDSMFCTLFVGVLDLNTGLLRFCNAGHNPPIYIPSLNHQPSTLNLRPSSLVIRPNMPLYAFDHYEYRQESMQMQPGDRLFLYTDGVTEAKSADNRFYGTEATLASVNKYKALPFAEMVNGVLCDLKHFTKKAEQHDDITMLCVEYAGGSGDRYVTHSLEGGSGDRYMTHSLEGGSRTCPLTHFDSVKGRVAEIVDAVVEASQMGEDMKFRLAIEEPIQNIADYAYEDDGPLDVEIHRDDCVRIILRDSGKPFNPLENQAPDLSVPIADRQVGGLGIFLTRQIMSEVSYKYENQQNNLILSYQPCCLEGSTAHKSGR